MVRSAAYSQVPTPKPIGDVRNSLQPMPVLLVDIAPAVILRNSCRMHRQPAQLRVPVRDESGL
jgi:hypothetical protein